MNRQSVSSSFGLGRVPAVFLAAPALLMLGGCAFNASIGWPGHYLDGGFFSFLTYLAVLALLGLAGITLVAAANSKAKKDDTKGFSVCALFFGGLALLVLQAAPAAESGLQLLPHAPWNFATTVGMLLSGAAYVSIALGVFALFSGAGGDAEGASAALGFTILSAVLVYSASNCSLQAGVVAAKPTPKFDPKRSVASNLVEPTKGTPEYYRFQVDKWTRSRDQLQTTLAKFEADRVDVRKKLVDAGVRGASDLAKSQKARTLAEELLEVVQQINLLEKKVDLYDDAVVRFESGLRRVERQELLKQSGAVSEEELKQLSRIEIELDEQLKLADTADPAAALEIDALIEAEVGKGP